MKATNFILIAIKLETVHFERQLQSYFYLKVLLYFLCFALVSEYQENSDSCGHLHKGKVFQQRSEQTYSRLKQRRLLLSAPKQADPKMPTDTPWGWYEATLGVFFVTALKPLNMFRMEFGSNICKAKRI